MKPLSLTFLLLLAMITPPSSSSSTTPESDELVASERSMQAAGYYTFVTLMHFAADLISPNTTFLMPEDHLLSDDMFSDEDVSAFLSRHSIPSALPSDILHRLPTRTWLPMKLSGFSLAIANDGTDGLRLNNVRIVRPDVCGVGRSVACHGVDGVVERLADSNSSHSGKCFLPGTAAVPAASPPEPSDGGDRVTSGGWLHAMVVTGSLYALSLA